MDPAEHQTKLTVAFPADKTGSQIFYDTLHLEQLAKKIGSAAGPEKKVLPWLKLARFGNRRSPGGSLRTDANLTHVTGIEGDYDGEKVTYAEACKRFEALGIAGIIYTSPSNTAMRPRWRVLAPFSAEREVTDAEQTRLERAGWLYRIEKALGVQFSTESFTLSQSYYYGRTEETDFHGRLFHGDRYIDQLPFAEGGDREALRRQYNERRNRGHARLTVGQLLTLIAEGNDLHPLLASYTMRLGNAGKSAEEIRAAVEAALEGCDREPERIDALLNSGELDRLIASAVRKSDHVSAADEFDVIEEDEPVSADDFFLDLVDLSKRAPEPPRFIIPHWLPEGAVTLYAADGGGGKSFVSLDIAVRLTLGLPVFGQEVQPCSVMVIAAEDDAHKLHWRLTRMTDAYGVGLEDLAGRLLLRDATCDDNPMVVQTQQGVGITARFREIERLVKQHRPKVLVLDNASDFYAANENDRAGVRYFITRLNQLARENDGAVILLAHVNAQTVKGEGEGKTYSGSTAWSNSVRSRWFQQRDPNSDRIMLRLEKSNYGTVGLAVPVDWDDAMGMFRVGETVNVRRPNEPLLRSLLLELVASGANVDRKQKAPANPMRLLRGDRRWPPGVSWEVLDRVITQMVEEGVLHEVEVKPKGSNKSKKDWSVKLRLPDPPTPPPSGN